MCTGFELEDENFPRWDTYQQSNHDSSDEDVK
jgi:hypothetical protein